MKTPLLLASLLLAPLCQAAIDLNGLWFPAGSTQNPKDFPFTPQAKKWSDDYLAKFKVENDPGGWCVSPGLPRSIWGAPFPVEIQQNDNFITMFWEGYFQYRKIYIEGKPRPEPVLNTRMGYSVGHWEGDTLVVTTDHLREYPYMRRLPNSENAKIVERITVENRKDAKGNSVRTLVNQLTLTDPTLYTQPVTVTGNLRWSPDTPIMEYSCSEDIYDMQLEKNGLHVPDFSQGK